MPNGCNVLALFMRWASRAFLTESRLLRWSSMGMRQTSLIEWPAWLEWSDTSVVVLSCWWFRIERRCSPKRSLSWRLVSPMYWRWHLLHSIRYIRFLEWQDMESVPKFRGCAISRTRVIRQKVSAKIIGLSMETPCWSPSEGLQHGSNVATRNLWKHLEFTLALSKRLVSLLNLKTFT